MSFASCILHGNLCRDPELRSTAQNKSVAEFGVAVNEGGKDKPASFFDVVAWEKTAEFVAQYFKKGDPIIIEGRLVQDTWDDKETGKKRSKVKVVANRVHFAGGKKEGAPAPQGRPGKPTAEQLAAIHAAASQPIEEDSLPF